MRVIIAGSRTIQRSRGDELVKIAVRIADMHGWQITEVVCGEARGIDTCGRFWAERNKIPVKSFPADWNGQGKAAGYARNAKMAEYADGLIAITNGSPGTRHMINIARGRNMPVVVIEIPRERPANYADLPPQEQWEIDKKLGILEWNGQ